jgi:drug/metabolite transporter (DMT)-like permease
MPSSARPTRCCSVGWPLLSFPSVFASPCPSPTGTAWLGFAFLLVFGSLISFTSFLKALHLLPTRLVFTYGYVNPVIAAFLGWLVLGERIAGPTLAGASLVLLGVAGHFGRTGSPSSACGAYASLALGTYLPTLPPPRASPSPSPAAKRRGKVWKPS